MYGQVEELRFQAMLYKCSINKSYEYDPNFI